MTDLQRSDLTRRAREFVPRLDDRLRPEVLRRVAEVTDVDWEVAIALIREEMAAGRLGLTPAETDDFRSLEAEANPEVVRLIEEGGRAPEPNWLSRRVSAWAERAGPRRMILVYALGFALIALFFFVIGPGGGSGRLDAYRPFMAWLSLGLAILLVLELFRSGAWKG
jgi:hypothetical protein